MIEGELRFNPEVRGVAGSEELYCAAAMVFIQQARDSIETRGLFTVTLSGGSTPIGLYRLLADDLTIRAPLAWDKIHFFWGDERHVPPEHPDSNYRLAKEAILEKIPIPPENVHRVRSENPNAHQVAEEYEEMLRTFFRLEAGEYPRFDLVLLGMGSDGHTASLFPGTEALHDERHLVVANWIEKFQAYRITMTIPVFNHAAFVLFLVSGEEKAETLRLVLEEGRGKDTFPARLIRPCEGKLLWIVDQGAGRLLHKANNPIESKE